MVMIYSLRAVRPDCVAPLDRRYVVPTTGRFRKLRFLLDLLAAGVAPLGGGDRAKAPAE